MSMNPGVSRDSTKNEPKLASEFGPFGSVRSMDKSGYGFGRQGEKAVGWAYRLSIILQRPEESLPNSPVFAMILFPRLTAFGDLWHENVNANLEDLEKPSMDASIKLPRKTSHATSTTKTDNTKPNTSVQYRMHPCLFKFPLCAAEWVTAPES
ncbi:hypothetical protein BDP27DRAFT_1502632 [Rhodocollybia butyracea]|uniref:Uncharacterized protein n=1 Tax=Rhodocollybia butyracea TaxID=206335 RepID=A0A9P5TX49_9AGAR|nr:hypothetical protein BDP27DRAFT_1502632 [Rhodocollybia butyracea]